MKSRLLFYLFLIIALQINCQTAPSGTGTSTDPYIIANLSNLQAISESSSYWTGGNFFIQTEDIDATATLTWNDGKGFRPMGNEDNVFTGNYDGQGHSISNLYINNEFYCAFIGKSYGAQISNLSLDNVSITGKKYLGGLVGYATYQTMIQNCSTSGTITFSSSLYIGGGIAGAIQYASEIKNCFSTVELSGPIRLGGIAGAIQYASEIKNCFSTVELSGPIRLGGIVGSINDNCKILNSYYIGTISGIKEVGGIVGYMININNVTIQDCFAVANISCKDTLKAGHLVGINKSDDINYCLYLDDNKLPAVGYDSNDISFNSSNFQGLSESELQSATTYIEAGWDFSTTWCLDDTSINNGYPYLYWQHNDSYNLCVVENETTTTIEAPDVNAEIEFDSPLPSGTQILINLHPSETTSHNGLPNSEQPLGDNFWEIKTTFSEPRLYSISLNLENTEIPSDPDQIKIFKREDENSDWIDVVSLGASLAYENKIVTISGLSSFSDFMPVIEVNTLPVELSSFTAELMDNDNINIEWEVESESNLLGYYLMKSSSNNLGNAQLIPSLIEPTNTAHYHQYRVIEHPDNNEKHLFYWLKSVALNNHIEYYGPVFVSLNEGANDTPNILLGSKLFPPYPNPFNPTTSLSFSVDQAQFAELKVYNIKGQIVRNLLSEFIETPNVKQSIIWDGKDNDNNEISSGLYFVLLELEKRNLYRKVILVK